MMDVSLIPKNAILTPHHGEFKLLWDKYQRVNASAQEVSTKIE